MLFIRGHFYGHFGNRALIFIWKGEVNMTITTESTEDNDEFLTVNEMMRKLKVSRTVFWRMRKNGETPKAVTENPLRWRKKDLDAFYDKRAGL